MILKPHEIPTEPEHERLKEPARLWFEALRDRLCAAFEAIEDSCGQGGGPGGALLSRRRRAPLSTCYAFALCARFGYLMHQVGVSMA